MKTYGNKWMKSFLRNNPQVAAYLRAKDRSTARQKAERAARRIANV
jgi:hypothetical protein